MLRRIVIPIIEQNFGVINDFCKKRNLNRAAWARKLLLDEVFRVKREEEEDV